MFRRARRCARGITKFARAIPWHLACTLPPQPLLSAHEEARFATTRPGFLVSGARFAEGHAGCIADDRRWCGGRSRFDNQGGPAHTPAGNLAELLACGAS